MAAFADSVRFLAASGGTADFVYSSTVQGYQSPALANVQNGVKYKWRAESADLSQWEEFEGAWNTSTATAPRTTVLYNSGGTGSAAGQSGAGSKINFSAAPQIALVALAEDLISVEQSNAFTQTQRTQGRANLGAAINELSNVSFNLSVSAGALTVGLTDANGNNATSTTPIGLSFRNPGLTASPNTPTLIELQTAASIVVPSSATLGFASSQAGRLYFTAWNDGGTFRLGVFKASTSSQVFPLPMSGVASSALVGTGSTSAGVHYTSGAAVTGKAFRVVGYADWNASGMTAGTWTLTNLNSIVTAYAGMPLPGLPIGNINTFLMPSTSQSSHTSSLFTATNTTVNLTPTNAANLVRAKAFGTTRVTSSSDNADVTLARGGTAIGAFVSCRNDANATNTWWPTHLDWLDFPNSVSQQTYAVYLREGTGGTGEWGNPPGTTGNNAYIEVEEICG